MPDTIELKNKLVMPQKGTYLELEQEEMEYVDGGGRFVVTVSVSGMLAGLCSGVLTQLLCGFISGAVPGITKMAGPWMWAIGTAIGIILSAALYNLIFSNIDRIITNGFTIIDISHWLIPNISLNIGNMLYKFAGRLYVQSLTSASAYASGHALGQLL